MLKRCKKWLLKRILRVGLNSILITCKWEAYNTEIFLGAQKKSLPVFLCCWHSRFILIASYFKKIKLPIWSVSSTHKDSEMMAGVLEDWGLRLVRGSSTRGWNHVLKQLIKLFKKDSSIIAITNDGPKGPPMVAKKGSIMLALKNKVQIIAVSGEASRYWKLPSWDGTIIPKPFSIIYIQFAERLNDENLEGKEVKIISDYITNNYNDLNNKNKQ